MFSILNIIICIIYFILLQAHSSLSSWRTQTQWRVASPRSPHTTPRCPIRRTRTVAATASRSAGMPSNLHNIYGAISLDLL